MSDHLWLEAETLAKRPYMLEMRRDTTTSGEYIYIAHNPELPGCKAQGGTPDETIRNLDEARIDFIYFLLEDGLTVPEPMLINFTDIAPIITEHPSSSDNSREQNVPLTRIV